MSQSSQPWLSYGRQCSETLNHQYTTTPPPPQLTLATTSFLPCDKRTKWPPWTKRPITHQHRVNVTKVSSRLTDKDSQPPVYQVSLGQRVYILPEALWATLGHLPPIPQHPRTPGHKVFRSHIHEITWPSNWKKSNYDTLGAPACQSVTKFIEFHMSYSLYFVRILWSDAHLWHIILPQPDGQLWHVISIH